MASATDEPLPVGTLVWARVQGYPWCERHTPPAWTLSQACLRPVVSRLPPAHDPPQTTASPPSTVVTSPRTRQPEQAALDQRHVLIAPATRANRAGRGRMLSGCRLMLPCTMFRLSRSLMLSTSAADFALVARPQVAWSGLGRGQGEQAATAHPAGGAAGRVLRRQLLRLVPSGAVGGLRGAPGGEGQAEDRQQGARGPCEAPPQKRWLLVYARLIIHRASRSSERMFPSKAGAGASP